MSRDWSTCPCWYFTHYSTVILPCIGFFLIQAVVTHLWNRLAKHPYT